MKKEAIQSLLGLLFILLIAWFFTGRNLFHFPHYEFDEGLYVSSAWAMVTQGRLGFYTYTYNTPPLSWLLLGGWAALTGGFEQFGSAVNSGRMFMLIVHLISTLFLFLTVHQITQHISAALIGGLIFIIFPLGVQLHRQVLPDNVAILWLLISVYLLIINRGRLSYVVWSAVAFGLAFWSKMSLVLFFWPIFIYLALTQVHLKQRRFAGALWLSISLALTSLFPLMALLRDELLPPGVLWSSDQPHVSMLNTFLYPSSTHSAVTSANGFLAGWQQWIEVDPTLMVGGLIVVIAGGIAWHRDPILRSILLMLALYTLFLGIGNTVYMHYALPVLTLLALGVGLITGRLLDVVAQGWPASQKFSTPVIGLLIAILLSYGAQSNRDHFLLNRTGAQQTVTAWISETLPPDSRLIVDTHALVDLRNPTLTGGKVFSQAHVYTFANNDPNIRFDVLDDSWQNVDYVTVNATEFFGRPQMDGLDLMTKVVENSELVKIFAVDDFEIQLRRVRKPVQFETPSDPLLTRTWESYKQHFIEDGRVIDPARNGATTSEGQSYALLRAVYMNDRATFDAVWRWSQNNLQRPEDALFAWLWGQRQDGSWGVLDDSGATDADQDIALALLFADRRWNEPVYADAARPILRDIWAYKTEVWQNQRVLLAGNWAQSQYQNGTMVINPSYFAPYAYRIFAQADPDRTWLELVDSSYLILDKIQTDPGWGGQANLVPNWVRLDVTTGALKPFEEIPDSTQYGFDAMRVPWRIAIDWLWFQDVQAHNFLQNFHFLSDEFMAKQQLAAVYNLNGSPAVAYESVSTYGTLLPSLLVSGDTEIAQQIFDEHLVNRLRDDNNGIYWEQPDNYYAQNWAWFSAAVMTGTFANLWADETVIDWQRLNKIH